jgi:uncharacterized protein (DUF1330 family)
LANPRLFGRDAFNDDGAIISSFEPMFACRLVGRAQGELDLYREMAPTALAGHPITFRIAHGHKEVVEGPDFEDMMMLEFPTFREARAWYNSCASALL